MSRANKERQEPELTLYVASPTFIRDSLNDQLSKMNKQDKTSWDSDDERRERAKKSNNKVISVRSVRPSDRDDQPTPVELDVPITYRQVVVEDETRVPTRTRAPKPKPKRAPLNRSQFVRRQYKDLVPNKYIMLHGVALTVLGVMAIGLQVGLMILRYGFFNLGAGFWIGFFYWVLIVMVLAFCN